MKLDILIPYFNEPLNVLNRLLISVAQQQNVDFRNVTVHIYNDGGTPIPISVFEGRPFTTVYHEGEHRGVSATRNRLMDLSDGDYIMCCDTDDMFTDMFALSYIFKAIKKGFDVFNAAFYEEGRNKQGEKMYIVRKNDTYFVHGKVFRRQYLVENNIRWNDEFTYSGDSYFLGLALRITKKHAYCSTPFYIWKWNQNSICRREKNHYEKEFDMKLRVMSALTDELMRRGLTEDARYFALFVVYDAYYVMQADGWEAMPESDRAERRKQFREFYRKYEKMIEEADKRMRLSVIKTAKNNQFFRGNIMEKITYANWLKTILDDRREDA